LAEVLSVVNPVTSETRPEYNREEAEGGCSERHDSCHWREKRRKEKIFCSAGFQAVPFVLLIKVLERWELKKIRDGGVTTSYCC